MEVINNTEVSPQVAKFVITPDELTKVNLNQIEKELDLSEDFGKLKSGSLFKYAQLKNEKPKNVLIFCHGYRPVGIPLAAPYAANDNPHLSVYNNLMKKEKFAIAAVSYRREGVIYLDAVEDILEMREHVLTHYFPDGFRGKIIIQARSMGGAIVTLLNERYGHLFHGIIGLGSALHMNTTDGPVEFLYTPRTKQIFIANCSEFGVVEKYVAKVSEKAQTDNTIIVPSVFQVSRFGHCAVFDSELAESFRCLLEWINSDSLNYESKDVTNYAEQPRDDLCTWDDEKKGYWCPVSLTMYYTVVFPMTEENWSRCNIRPRTTFTCEIYTEDGVETREILFATDPFVGVTEGTLIAFVTGTGQRSCFAYHYTGTTVNNAGKDLKIRREGHMIFIYEKRRTQPKKI